MKFIFYTFLAFIGALALGAVIIIANSRIQTQLFNTYAKVATADSVSVGLSSATVQNLRLKDGFSAAQINVSYSLSSLMSDVLEIDSLEIAGARIAMPKKDSAAAQTPTKTDSAAHPKPAEAVGAAKPDKTQLPWKISVKKLSADIEADGKVFKIAAKDVSIGKNLLPENWNLEISSDDAKLTSSLAPEKDSRRLKLLASLGADKLVQLSALTSPDFSSISAETRVDLTDAQLAKIAPAPLKLPKFSAAVYVKGQISDMGKNADLKLIGKTSVSGLEKFSPQLKALGECVLTAEIDASKKGESISVSKLHGVLSEGKTPLLSVDASPFAANTIEDASKAEITATIAIPARIPNAFLSGMQIRSDDICGKISARYRNDAAEISIASPVSFTRLYIDKGKEPLVENLNAFLSGSAVVGKEISADLNLQVADSKTSAINFAAKIKSANGAFNVSLKSDGHLNPIITRIHSVSAFASQNLKISLSADADFAGADFSLNNFSARLLDSSGTPVADIRTIGKIKYADGILAGSQTKLVSIDAPKFPFALLKPFAPEVDIAALSAKAEISSPAKDSYAADFDVSAKSIYYKKDGKYLVQNLNVSALGKASYANGKADVKIEKGIVGEGAGSFAVLGASARYDAANGCLEKVALEISASLPQILNQPALIKYSNLSRGTLEAKADYENKTLTVSAAVHSMTARSVDGSIDSLSANLKYSGSEASANISAKSTRGETNAKADVKFGAEISAVVDAKSIVVEDVMLLAAAFKNDSSQASELSRSAEAGKSQKIARPDISAAAQKSDTLAKKDSSAFWYQDKPFSADLKIGEVFKDGKILLKNFAAAVAAKKASLALKKFEGSVFGAKFSGTSNITFNAKRAVPYELEKSSFTMTSFEISQVFANAKNPPISGVYDISATVSGTGNNAEHLFTYIVGSGTAKSSSGGHITVLEKGSLAGTGAAVAGSVLRITGELLDNRVKELSGIGDIVSLLSDINYTSATVQISRNAKTYNLNIDTAELRTDSLIFYSAGGKIFYEVGVPFKDHKIEIPAQLFVAGSTQTLFQKIGYGKETSARYNGFYDGPQFAVSGTVSQPTNNLINVLTNTKAQIGNMINKLNIFK